MTRVKVGDEVYTRLPEVSRGKYEMYQTNFPSNMSYAIQARAVNLSNV